MTPPARRAHFFDIGDPTNPEALTFVATPCGSHTASGVLDLANNRLLVYSSPSSNAAACRGIDIIEVPLGRPGRHLLPALRPLRRAGPGLPEPGDD